MCHTRQFSRHCDLTPRFCSLLNHSSLYDFGILLTDFVTSSVVISHRRFAACVLALEDWTDRLSRNVGKKLSLIHA
jgi:hypothetical protein